MQTTSTFYSRLELNLVKKSYSLQLSILLSLESYEPKKQTNKQNRRWWIMRITTNSFMAVNTRQAKHNNLPLTDTTESRSSCLFFSVRCSLSIIEKIVLTIFSITYCGVSWKCNLGLDSRSPPIIRCVLCIGLLHEIYALSSPPPPFLVEEE